ncbi:MAG: KamA family radical SAM protein [Fibrobacterales bacterium]|nr:KamA family radical SAM protein [Fibrobacterales bacterium]
MGANGFIPEDLADAEDWRAQLRNSIRDVEALKARFPGLPDPEGIARAAARFPFSVTPYYASLVEKPSFDDPIFRMSVPSPEELDDPPFLLEDPIGENRHMVAPGLVHRYPDRAMLISTSFCAVYCRHCTRKRITGAKRGAISEARLDEAAAYLKAHPEVKDVLVSGGDPLLLPTPLLERIVRKIREVPSVEVIRICTRAPVTLPMRIDDELLAMLRRHGPIWMNTHFNHPRELTPRAVAAAGAVVDAGIPLCNQSVLLRGVNDDPLVMEELVRGLLRARIKPYYLFQCDLVRGIEHFRTPISKGLEIMEHLRGRVSGLAIPCYAFDVPGGEGKVPLLPEYIVSKSETHTVLRTWRGLFFDHPEPRPAGAAPEAPAGTSWNDDFCARAITDRRTSDRDFGEWLEEIPEV